MDFLAIIDIILVILLIYFIFIHEYMLGRRKFKCLRCGRCCRLTVNLTEEEINKIKKAGYKDFFTKDNKLKKVNGYCVFLTLNNGITACKLENSAKPKICKDFPLIPGLYGRKYDKRCSAFNKFNIMH
jgi:Fe-S-cluster containining protein